MTRPDEFVQSFREAVASRGWRRPFSPTEVLEMWEQFVEWCEHGYNWSIYEYENELAVRDLIESLFHQKRLEGATQMEWFRERVGEVDSRFRALLSSGPVVKSAAAPWWRERVPPYAGSEMAADLESQYGVVVDVRE